MIARRPIRLRFELGCTGYFDVFILVRTMMGIHLWVLMSDNIVLAKVLCLLFMHGRTHCDTCIHEASSTAQTVRPGLGLP
jgi:hypothetical protein